MNAVRQNMDLFALIEEMVEDPARAEWLLALECAIVLLCLGLAWLLPILD